MNNYIFNHQILLFFVIISCVLLWTILSVYKRKKDGKLIIGDPNVNILFKEKNASGHSNKNILTKIGGAKNSLKVILSDELLVITPYFPFNLLFLPNIHDLEYFINYRDIIEIKKGFMKSLNISFKYGTEVKEINLILRNKEEFIKTISGKLEQNKIAI